jgi:hypothetical protein
VAEGEPRGVLPGVAQRSVPDEGKFNGEEETWRSIPQND